MQSSLSRSLSYSARTLRRMRGHPRTWPEAVAPEVEPPTLAVRPVTLLPSGWAPPLGADPSLPFQVRRSAAPPRKTRASESLTPTLPRPPLLSQVLRTSKGKQVPVYSDFKNGHTRRLTIVRKIVGDEEALAREIYRVTGGAAVAVRPGRIEVEGDRRAELKTWLMGIGF